MDKYTGLHALEKAKEIMWDNKGFCGLNRNIKKEQFEEETDIKQLNEWMSRGKIVFIGTVES